MFNWVLPFDPLALCRRGTPCESEGWPPGKLPLYLLKDKSQVQDCCVPDSFTQVRTLTPLNRKWRLDITKPVEGVMTLHVLWVGGEGSAAGVLMDFSRSHDRELSCKHQQPASAWRNSPSWLYQMIMWPEEHTNHTGPLDFLHIAVGSGDFPVPAIELTCSLGRCFARHFYSEKDTAVTTEEEPVPTDRKDWRIPDTVGEEEMWWMDGRQLGEERGRYRNGDVIGGGHATLIVHIPAGVIITGGVFTVFGKNKDENEQILPKDLVSDYWKIPRDHVVDVGREPIEETGTWTHRHENTNLATVI